MTSDERHYHDAHEDTRSWDHARRKSERRIRELEGIVADGVLRRRGNLETLLTVVDPQPCDFEGCVE